ncbi:MAG: hypothetical protein E7Z92_05415 [Cyanobacteria bacterium SIG31]|nr:hypothetical protein [Cyanobacteria bacterium SIG31]
MKKILITLILLFCVNNTTFAFGEIDRQVALDTSVTQVQKIILDLIKSYDGVITPKEINEKELRYIVNYNGSTFLSAIGVSNGNWSSDKYVKAIFSCQLKPVNNGKDVLIINRKHTTTSLFFSHYVFRHYKKIYHELKLNDIELIKYKEYKTL